MVRKTGFNLRSSHTKDSKIVLDATLLSTQHYKVRIKGNGAIQGMEQCPLLHLSVVAIEKGAFWSPSNKVTNLYHFNLVFFKVAHRPKK